MERVIHPQCHVTKSSSSSRELPESSRMVKKALNRILPLITYDIHEPLHALLRIGCSSMITSEASVIYTIVIFLSVSISTLIAFEPSEFIGD